MTRLLKTLLLTALLLLPTFAFAEYRTVEIEGMRITIDSDWTGLTTPGYVPIRLDITNSGDNREIRIVGNSNRYYNMYRRGRPYTGGGSFFGGGPSITATMNFSQTVTLKRGDRVKLTIPFPVAADNENGSLRIWENGKQLGGFSANVNVQSGIDADSASVLFVADPSGPFFPQAGAWARGITPGSGGGRYYYPPSRTGPGGPAVRVTLPRIDFSLDPERLPSNWLGYTSLRAVAIPPMEWGQLTPSQKEALLTWTAAGGDLLLVDGTLDTILPADKRPGGMQTTNPAFNNYFLGHIHLVNSASVVDETGMKALMNSIAIGSPHADWTLPANRSMDWGWVSARGFRLPIKGVGGIPTRTYLSMLVLFSVIIGPLNYFYLWRKKQQVLLIATVPLLSLLFIGVIVAYGFLGEGFSVRGRAASFTILDQTTKQAATRTSVTVYTGGITPGGGLTFPAQMAVFPMGADGIGFRGNATLDLTDSQRYSRGILQARSPSNFDEIGFGPARERLTIERNGNEFTVTNGMGSDITHLYYRDNSAIYTLSGKLGAGQKGALKQGSLKGSDLYVDMSDSSLNLDKFNSVVNGQQNGTYLAVLEKSPFWDPGVSQIDEKQSLHLVLGYTGGVQ